MSPGVLPDQADFCPKLRARRKDVVKIFLQTGTVIICVVALLHGTGWTADQEKLSVPEVKKEMKQAAQSLRELATQEKEDYVQALEAKLDDLSQRIDTLEKRLNSFSGQIRPKLEQKLSELKEKQAAAEKSLAELKSSSSKAWVDMKAGLEMALKIVEESYQKALNQFK